MRIISICPYHAITTFIALSMNIVMFAQNADNKIEASDLKNFEENLYIRTDRDIYITGEMVWLKIYKINSRTRKPMDLSKIVYLEVLDNSGNPVNQIKIRVDGTSVPSGLRLSDTLSTGSYLIRAYTAWMLNQSETTFGYKAITIINPNKNIERLAVESPADIKDSLNRINKETVYSVNKPLNNSGINDFIIKAEPDKNEYNPRDEISLNISVVDGAGYPVNADLSVSVVKNFLIDSACMMFAETSGPEDSAEYLFDHHENLPEMEGELVRGIIRDKTTNEPLKNTQISLSFVGRIARCQFARTDDKGEFLFVVKNVYGLNEAVIQPVIQDNQEFYIEIYQPFCNTFSRSHPVTLHPDSLTIEGINKAVISMQINSAYDKVIQKPEIRSDTLEMRSFYGNPTQTIKLSDYIDLTNIREVVKELLSGVKVIKKDNKYDLRVVSSNPYEQFENPPLILVDGVPVYDIEQLLTVSSNELERIDFFNTRYFISDLIFEGIVSFYTKKADLSVLDTDYSGYRQVFDGCAEPQYFYSPDYRNDTQKESHIPDFRNTLYWDPGLRVTEKNSSSVRFFTSDEKGIYLIIIEGVTGDGRTETCTVPLRVK